MTKRERHDEAQGTALEIVADNFRTFDTKQSGDGAGPEEE